MVSPSPVPGVLRAAGKPVLEGSADPTFRGDASRWNPEELLVAALVRFGRMQAAPPVLFYQHDSDLLLIARHRDRLRRWFAWLVLAIAGAAAVASQGKK